MDNLPLMTKIFLNGGSGCLTLILVIVLFKQVVILARTIKQPGAGTNGGKETRLYKPEIEAVHHKVTTDILEKVVDLDRGREAQALTLQAMQINLKETNVLLRELIEITRLKSHGG